MANGDSVTVQIKAILDTADITGKIKQIQTDLEKGLNLTPSMSTSMTKEAQGIEKTMNSLYSRLNKGFKTKGDVSGLEKDFAKLQTQVGNFYKTISRLDAGGLDFSNIKFNDDEINKIKQYEEELKNLQSQMQIVGQSNLSSKDYTTKDYDGQIHSIEELIASFNKLSGLTGGKQKLSQVQDLISKGDLESLQEANKLLDEIKKKSVNGITDPAKKSDATNYINGIQNKVNTLMDPNGQAAQASQQAAQINQNIENVKTGAFERVATTVASAQQSAAGLGAAVQEASGKSDKLATNMQRVSSETSMMASRLSYFFSTMNGARIFKNIVNQAQQAISEIDKAMTETAVVSSESVSSMWDKLPDYTSTARELGSTISDVVSAQTLYVQQGLSLDDSMGLAVQTLQMARVAGLDSATATNAMTAALHGFNMELNEASAQRINDVYSHLAQISASNVEEISTAMTKVASIANAANMEFETTSAFLSTIIETTRESAETAGTALKTVVARFSEVKKLYSEDELKGTDDEGETVDVNKIGTALKTAGIDLNKYFLGEVGLDDIFLELASKWDTLTNVQQRYIATQAAGSRQQSRFIALMQNYDRTLELVNEAYDSEGSGEEQFDKTLDSYESKVNQMKDAWQEFLMGLANSDMIKGAIDGITSLLDKVNSFIDSLSGKSKTLKTLISAGGLIGTFLIGKKGVNGLMGAVGSAMGIAQQGGSKLGANAQLSDYLLRNINRSGKVSGGTQGLLSGAKGKLSTLAKQPGYLINAWKGDSQFGIGIMDPRKLPGNLVTGTQVGKGADAIIKQRATENYFNKTFTAEEQANMSEEDKQQYMNKSATSITDTDEVQAANEVYAEMSGQLNAVGNAMGMLGGLFITFSNMIGTSTKTAAVFSKTLKAVGLSLVAFCGFTKLAQVAIQTFSTSATAAIDAIPIIGWLAAIISFIVLVGSLIVQFGDFRSESEKAADAAEQASESYSNWEERLKEVQEEYDGLKDGLSEVNEELEDLNDLQKGTEEWSDQINKVNKSVLDLVGTYSELAAFMKISEDGTLYLDYNMKNSEGKTIEDVEDDYQNQVTDIQDKTYAAGIVKSTTNRTSKLYDFYNETKGDDDNTSFKGTTVPAVQSAYIESQIGGLTDLKSQGYLWSEISEQGIELIAEMMDYGVNLKEASEIQKYANNNGIELSKEEAQLLSDYYNYSLGTERLGELQGIVGSTSSQDAASKNLLLKSKEQQLKQTGKYNNTEGEILSLYFNDNNLDKKQQEIDTSEYTENEILQFYKDAYADDNENYTVEIKYDETKKSNVVQVTDSDGNVKQNPTLEEARKNMAYDVAAQELYDQANSVVQEVTALSTSAVKGILTNNTRMVIQSLASGDVYNEDNVAQTQAMSDVFGVGLDNVQEEYENRIAYILSETITKYGKVINKLAKTSGKKIDGSNSEELVDFLNNVVYVFSDTALEQLKVITDDLDKVDTSGKLSDTFYEQIEGIQTNANQIDTENFINGINDINPEESIDGIRKLNHEIENASNDMVDYYTNMKQAFIDSGAWSDSALIQNAIKRNISDMQSTLEEDIAADNEIDLNDLDSLLEKYDDLQVLLDETDITAVGLAKALTEIGRGHLTFDSLTDAVVASLSSMGKLDSIVKDVQNEISDFKVSDSEGTIVSFYTKAFGVLKDNLKNGFVGDVQNGEYLSKIFGNEIYDGVDNYTDFYTNGAGADYLERLQKINTNGDFSSEWERLAKKNVSGAETTITTSGGVVNWSGYEGKTTEQLVQDLMENYDVESEFLAESMIADFKRNSPDLEASIKEAEYQEGLDSFQSRLNDTGYYTTQDIKTFAELWEVSTTKVLKDLDKTGLKLNELFGDDGELRKYGDAALDATDEISGIGETYNQTIAKIGNSHNNRGADNKALFDYEAIVADIQKAYNISEAQAETLAQQYLETQTNANVLLKDGSIAAVDDLTGNWETALSEAEDNAEYKALAETFVAAFSDTPITLQLDSTEGEKTITTLRDLWNNNTTFNKKVLGVTVQWGSQAATGGYVPSMAGGGHRLKGGVTLTGEEGPEIVWNKEEGYSYLTGVNGPNYTVLKSGDRVFAADETKDILKNSGSDKKGAMAKGGLVGSAAGENEGSTAYGDKNKITIGGSNSNSKSDKTDAADWIYRDLKDWIENPFNPLYNYLQDIESLEAQLTHLESVQTELQSEQNVSAAKLWSNLQQQLTNLNSQKNAQQVVAQESRKALTDTIESEWSEYTKYFNFDDSDNGEWGSLTVDWDAVEKETRDSGNKDKIEELKEFKSAAENLTKQYNDAIGDLDKIEKNQRTLMEQYQEAYIDFEKQVLDAIVDATQKQIDSLSDTNQAIKDTNSNLIDAINDSLDKERQEKQNQETEQDLSDKERRLAYLRQDSSNANALEIAQLEKELKDSKEDYTDTLIDQKISELQEQNDKAAEQREKQIELMNASLQWQKENGELWSQVNELLENAFDDEGVIKTDSEVYKLLESSEAFDGMSAVEKLKSMQELSSAAAAAEVYFASQNQLEDVGNVKEGQKVTFTDKNGTSYTGTYNKDGSVTVSNKDGTTTTFDDIYMKGDGSYHTYESYSDIEKVSATPATEEKKETTDSSGGSSGGGCSHNWIYQGNGVYKCSKCGKTKNGVKQKKWQYEAYDSVNRQTHSSGHIYNTEQQAKNAGKKKYPTLDIDTHYKEYKTGGLADFTGPAWLDGTTSSPELVLNSQDTKNFIELKNVLASLMNGSTDASVPSGDNYFDINIQVDSLSSDYDVDQLASKIKKEIYSDASYRNVNAIRNLR